MNQFRFQVRFIDTESRQGSTVEDKSAKKVIANSTRQANEAVIRFSVCGREVELLVDSGADVTTITTRDWEAIRDSADARLLKSISYDPGDWQKLHSYAGENPLGVRCRFKARVRTIEGNKPSKVEEIFVVEGAKTGVLSRNAGIAMELLRVGLNVRTLKIQQNQEIPEEFPSIPNLELEFNVDYKVQPSIDPVFSVPLALRPALKTELDRLLGLKIIEPATGKEKWMSRIMAVKRHNGDVRWVVTMCNPNKAIRRVRFPMPTSESLTTELKGAKVFSKLDIKSAYHHVKLSPASRELTTFMTEWGAFRFTRLVFGVNCAPELFQKIMWTILGSCTGVVIYLDDILIYADTVEQLRQRTEEVKSRLAKNNLTLNSEKCVYEQTEVEFLGLQLSETGIRPTTNKLEAIQNCARPANVPEVRSFLGLINFVGSFIPNLSHRTEPLRRLLKAGNQFSWGSDQQLAFDQLKKAMSSVVQEKGFFDADEDKASTWLYTDASGVGLGAVMLQGKTDAKPGDESLKPIAFASKSLTPTEMAYPQTHREALAVIWAVEKFRLYLIGRKFNLVVDHAPLTYILNRCGNGPKRHQTRSDSYAIRLGEYMFQVWAVKSGNNGGADYLSRALSMESMLEARPFRSSVDLRIATITTKPIKHFREEIVSVSTAEVAEANEQDKAFAAIKTATENGNWTGELIRYAPYREEFRVREKLLLRGNKLVVPKSLVDKILKVVHMNHAGATSMKRTIRDSMWWPGMDAEIDRWVAGCKLCAMVARLTPPEPMHRTRLPEKPWDFIAIDFFSLKSAKVSLLVVVDYFSRHASVRLMPETGAEAVCDQLENLFTTFGYPACIRSDNGPPFQSASMSEWAKNRGIKLSKSVPWAPQMNGEVESKMRGIKKAVIQAEATGGDWRLEVEKHTADYNRAVHPTTGKSPMHLMFGRKIRGYLPTTDWESGDEGLCTDEIRDRDWETKFYSKIKVDHRRRARESSLKVGDRVLTMNMNRLSLEPRFGGKEFIVTEVLPGAVVVQDAEGVTYRRSSSHVKKLNDSEITEESGNIGTTDEGEKGEGEVKLDYT